jgi:hypothetical protein
MVQVRDLFFLEVVVSAVLLLTHCSVSTEVEQEQLQPSDPNNPEYGLKPAAVPNALDNGTKSATEPDATDADKGIDYVGGTGTGSAAPSVHNSNGTSAYCILYSYFTKQLVKLPLTSLLLLPEYSTLLPKIRVSQLKKPSVKGKDVTLDELSSSLLRTLIPCIWCINDKKFEDPSFWKRAFLRRVTASEWEVLDELKDEVMDTLKWEGDNGLK